MLRHTFKFPVAGLARARLAAVRFNSGKPDLTQEKYNYIRKMNLDKPLHEIPQTGGAVPPAGEDGPGGPNGNSGEFSKTYEMLQRLQAGILGLVILGGCVAAYEGYQNWYLLKGKIFGYTYDTEEFFQTLEERKAKNAKKQSEIDRKTYTLTNPNNSTVPGVYLCGNNENRLVSPDPQTKFQTVFKRLDIFDNFLVRDVCLGSKSGALINDKGDLYQWGKGFGGDSAVPTVKGQRLTKVTISNDVVYALTSKGEVLYLPESQEEQQSFATKSRKLLLFSRTQKFRKLATEKPVKNIVGGHDHLVLLSKDGSVYTAATGLKPLKQSYGQFGIPTFSQFDTPPQPNEVHEVAILNKYREDGQILQREIKQIAAGDYFTLCLDNLGYVWAFGKNTYGSLGKQVNYNTEIVAFPSKVELISKYFNKTEFPQGVQIAAGGDTAYATFVSSNIYHMFEKSVRDHKQMNFSELSASQQDSLVHFSWGHGLKGELGVGHFVHGQAEPVRIKTLNAMKEFNETTNKLEALGVKNWSIGSNHAVVTLSNGDVYDWGDNEFGQLGNGKRIRSGQPVPVPSLLEPENTQNGSKPKKSVNDRLQLVSSKKFEQVIVAGKDTTAIYYRRH